MHILQIGAPRSGNFWVWRILQEIIDRAGLPDDSVVRSHPIHEVVDELELSHDRQADIDMLDILPRRSVWRVSSVWRMPIADIAAYVDRAAHVWTHSRYCERSPEVFRAFDRIVYVCRDPRDRALSSARFAFTPYMRRYFPHGEPDRESWLEHRFAEHVEDWTWHVFDHLRHRQRFDIHVVFYEQLLHQFDRTLDRLLGYLGVDLSAEQRAAIREAVTFDRMSEENPDHVREGRSERWREELSRARIRLARRIAGPLLGALGYARDEEEAAAVVGRSAGVLEGIDHGVLERRLVG